MSVSVWDGFDLLFEFEASGERQVVVASPLTLEVIPVTNPGIEAAPESRTFTFDHCTPGPTLTFPEDPGDPAHPETPSATLPFTGADEGPLALAGAAALVLGTILAIAFRREQEA